ncbi:uncharacterized protein MAL13P1.304-like [Microplitis mediator]|uniref:uncharacterized protein MAL13P1.304-like n=1 Tax=Microplitis mediator TaxID=375433 RepID=UPI00255708F8|nr:uncharacterized protein MAL13P1.304-like [Microplitis mediator]
MCQDINNSTSTQATANSSNNNINNNNNNNNKNNSKPDDLLFYNDKLLCDVTGNQSCSGGNKSSKDVQELILNNRSRKVMADDDNDNDYDKRINLNDINSINNLEMCPVTTTVSSEDLSGDGIFWDDVNLFKYSDYKLEFDIDDNYSNLKPTNSADNDLMRGVNDSDEVILKETVDSIDEYENNEMLDNILQDMPIDSMPISRPGNWSYLFDCHLANIESPDAILSSTELIDPKLTNKSKGIKSFSKHNYMVSLGLSKKELNDERIDGEDRFDCGLNEGRDNFKNDGENLLTVDIDKRDFNDFAKQSSSGVSSTTSIISEQSEMVRGNDDDFIDAKRSNRQRKIRKSCLKSNNEPALKKKKKNNIYQHGRLHLKKDRDSIKKN